MPLKLVFHRDFYFYHLHERRLLIFRQSTQTISKWIFKYAGEGMCEVFSLSAYFVLAYLSNFLT